MSGLGQLIKMKLNIRQLSRHLISLHEVVAYVQGRLHDVKSGWPWRARDRKGGLGLCPQWGPGARRLVRRSGVLRPPEAESFLHF